MVCCSFQPVLQVYRYLNSQYPAYDNTLPPIISHTANMPANSSGLTPAARTACQRVVNPSENIAVGSSVSSVSTAR